MTTASTRHHEAATNVQRWGESPSPATSDGSRGLRTQLRAVDYAAGAELLAPPVQRSPAPVQLEDPITAPEFGGGRDDVADVAKWIRDSWQAMFGGLPLARRIKAYLTMAFGFVKARRKELEDETGVTEKAALRSGYNTFREGLGDDLLAAMKADPNQGAKAWLAGAGGLQLSGGWTGAYKARVEKELISQIVDAQVPRDAQNKYCNMARRLEGLERNLQKARKRAYDNMQNAAYHGSKKYSMQSALAKLKWFTDFVNSMGGVPEPGVTGLEKAQDLKVKREFETNADHWLEQVEGLTSEVDELKATVERHHAHPWRRYLVQ